MSNKTEVAPELNSLDAMLEQYKNSSKSTSNTPKKEYDLKNYFSTHLKDNEKDATRRIRILPTNDGTSPFKEYYGHKVQVDGEWKTLACLKHEEGKDCPFCEANDKLRSSGTEAHKELAKKYNAKKMYVVKVIDRDHPDHGVKFWRFNHDYRKQGILDKIYGVLQAVGQDITNPTTGRDLLVLIARDQNKRPAVQTISQKDPSVLSADGEEAAMWLEDERTWRDVYAVKPYEYLEIIVKNGVPVWDKTTNKFVDKASLKEKEDNDVKDEIVMGGTSLKASKGLPTVPAVPAGEAESDDDDDMPF